MSLQQLIDRAGRIVFDRRQTVGQTISRSQRIKTQQRLTAQPFLLTVTPPARLKWSTNRAFIESIYALDRSQESQIALGGNVDLSYITAYQGSITSTQLDAITVNTFTGRTIVLQNLPAVNAATAVFRAGDWIQPNNSRYPYIIQQDVLRGSGTLITATLHRSIITTEVTTITNAGILVGTETTLTVLISDLPTYEITEKGWAQFSGDFSLIERVL